MTDTTPPDWNRWTPTDVATLLFVRRGLEVLLIRKKRGLGAGKINAPGGRLEAGETPAEAAVREVLEEVGVTVTEPRARGELRFQFVDGYALHCHVFAADGCTGAECETDEAIPLWTALDAIPYAEMWADDALWIPKMLAGYRFDGRFVFDGERMAWHALTLDDPAAALFTRFEALGIAHTTHHHAPVFTVEQARAVRPPGAQSLHVKNLFLRDRKGSPWLVTLPEDHAVDLKGLARSLGVGTFSFASPARLREHLGVEAGAVTPLAALHDPAGAVRVALHPRLGDSPAVSCHPLTNDRTTTLSGPDLVRFLGDTGHPPVWIAAR